MGVVVIIVLSLSPIPRNGKFVVLVKRDTEHNSASYRRREVNVCKKIKKRKK